MLLLVISALCSPPRASSPIRDAQVWRRRAVHAGYQNRGRDHALGRSLGGTIRGTGTLRSATGVEGEWCSKSSSNGRLRRLVGVQSARTTRNGEPPTVCVTAPILELADLERGVVVRSISAGGGVVASPAQALNSHTTASTTLHHTPPHACTCHRWRRCARVRNAIGVAIDDKSCVVIARRQHAWTAMR